MRAISAVVGLVVLLAAATAAQDAGRASPSLLKATFSKLPIYFIENRGVYPDEVAYYVQGADKTLFFTKEGITFRLEGKDRAWVVKLEFVGANPDVQPRGEDKQQAVFSYFKGPENDWKTGLRTYAKVVYEDLWPGIDLVYKGTVNKLKYEFVVKPGADPGKIRLRYRGVSSVTVTDSGAVHVETPAGRFEDAPPEAWQEIEGKRKPVAAAFSYEAHSGDECHQLGIRTGRFDRTRALVLDPAVFIYCGYVGGKIDDACEAVAVDASGNAYVTGWTTSMQSSFPIKVGPDLTFNNTAQEGAGDAFVAKVNATGTGLVYCGYIGGSGREFGIDIAVDATGCAYVAGNTTSSESSFPVKVGPDLTINNTHHNSGYDVFVAKVNPKGSGLEYCGYIGGWNNDTVGGIVVDALGHAYVAGTTASGESTFPVKVGPDLTFSRGYEAFVAKVAATGKELVYCGFIGGTGHEYGSDVAVDHAGHAFVTGYSESAPPSFPVKTGPGLQNKGGGDIFVAKIHPAGTGFIYSGFVGGVLRDYPNAIAVDAAGNAYVAGQTSSAQDTFPVKVGPDITHNGWVDAFVLRVNATGTGLDYCGYIGGDRGDDAKGVAVDASGNAFVFGNTSSNSSSFPVKVGPDLILSGGCDAFVAKIEAGGTGLVYCGYVGGKEPFVEQGRGLAVDASGNAYVAGMTTCNETEFPVKVGPDVSFNGGYNGDGYVAKVGLVLLEGGGGTRPGSTTSFALTASDSPALPYQLGTSLGTGPIRIDTRQIDLSSDWLLTVSVAGWWPSVFSGYRGVIDAKGQAQAAIHIPNVPALIGVWLHSAFVTLDPAAPSGIRSISNTFTFSITK